MVKGKPVDTAIAARNARDVAAEMFLHRRCPRYELETETVVDHREAAGGERQALTISARDMFAAGRALERLPGLGRQLLANFLEFAPA